MITIQKITAAATYEIRLEVLRKNIDLPYQFEGDDAESTFHLGAYDAEKLIGIATFMERSGIANKKRQYQLRGMATLPKARGKGAGKLLITAAIEELQQRNIELLWCNAREVALPFYTKLQFEVVGDDFIVPKVGKHYKMQRIVN